MTAVFKRSSLGSSQSKCIPSACSKIVTPWKDTAFTVFKEVFWLWARSILFMAWGSGGVLDIAYIPVGYDQANGYLTIFL